jgi:uncharacterized protein YcbK (DUF882 family)
MRRRVFAYVLRAVAVVMAGTAMSSLITDTAQAKPTGWQSESEIRASGSSAWSGYGDSGYVARPKTPRAKAAKAPASKAAKAKSKALKAYGASYGQKPKKQASKGKKKQYAALDTGAMLDTAPAKSITGGGIRWVASAGCLNGTLRSVVAQVAASYGSVTVNSTCRSKGHNRKVGGAKKSHHLTGDAVDFRVRSGNVRAVYAFLRSHGSLGGVKHYGGGLFHIDTGPRRSF